jgi:hypothetical protein
MYMAKARVKGREPITFSISPEMLALVDAHAQSEYLDRYDVLRSAIAKGMVVMRIERELLLDRDGSYTTAMLRAAADGAAEDVQAVENGVLRGLERDVPEGPASLNRKRVKANDK